MLQTAMAGGGAGRRLCQPVLSSSEGLQSWFEQYGCCLLRQAMTGLLWNELCSLFCLVVVVVVVN